MPFGVEEIDEILRTLSVDKRKLISRRIPKSIIQDYGKFFRLMLNSIPFKTIIFVVPTKEDAENIVRVFNRIFPDREVLAFAAESNTNEILMLVQLGQNNEKAKELGIGDSIN
jgi:hypothetical protein